MSKTFEPPYRRFAIRFTKDGNVIRLGSLYSGIAGLELGVLTAFVEAGIPARIAWQCEIDPFCSRVLAHHFPNVQRFSDVATVHNPPSVDVLCGGFACQDVSSAGRGAGLGKETRSGFTLHHLLRIIDEIRPRYLVVENVASGAKRWLPRVVQELGDRGYRPRAVPLGAVDVGAPHRRLRVFVVADRDGAASSGLGGIWDGKRATYRNDACGRGQGTLAESAVGGRLQGAGDPSSAEQPRGWRPGVGRSGALPDADCELPQQPRGCGGARGAGAGVAGEHGEAMANGQRSGLEERSIEQARRQREVAQRGCAPVDERSPECGMGCDAHGLPFNVAGHSFPAGRGEVQHEWEAPRAVASDVKIPQCGLVAEGHSNVSV